MRTVFITMDSLNRHFLSTYVDNLIEPTSSLPGFEAQQLPAAIGEIRRLILLLPATLVSGKSLPRWVQPITPQLHARLPHRFVVVARRRHGDVLCQPRSVGRIR